MLDGRQVAVLAALVEGDTARAAVLLADTMPGDPWEQAVTACLTVLCRRDAGQTVDGHLADLAAAYLERRSEPGMTVFDARLALTVLDAIGSADSPTAHCIIEDLHRRTMEAEDGYAARENLAHPLFTAIATDLQAQGCRALVRSCALGAGTMRQRQGDPGEPCMLFRSRTCSPHGESLMDARTWELVEGLELRAPRLSTRS
jgi:hypothetical protein